MIFEPKNSKAESNPNSMIMQNNTTDNCVPFWEIKKKKKQNARSGCKYWWKAPDVLQPNKGYGSRNPSSMETMAAAIEHAVTANQAHHHPALN